MSSSSSCIFLVGCLLITAIVSVSGFGCENDNVHLDCGSTRYIYVTEAFYGRRKEDLDLCDPELTEFKTCTATKATETVRELCNGKHACDIVASNDVFQTDPCPGNIKYLDPEWYCVTVPSATYRGCFSTNDFTMFSMESDEMSVERCLAHCRSFTHQEYAGLRDGRYCSCASTTLFSGVGEENEEFCEKYGEPCTGNKAQMCGSEIFTSVYRLDAGSIRLVGSQYLASNEGRIEIESYGSWNTICGHGFDIYDADVACRMVGYLGAETYFKTAEKFGEGSDDILLSGLKCSGKEKSLLDCSHNGLYDTDSCTHADDVGVVCRQWQAVEAGDSDEDSEVSWLSDNSFWILIDVFIFVVVIGFTCIVRRRQLILRRQLRRHVGFCEALLFFTNPGNVNHARAMQGSLPARPVTTTNRYGGQRSTVSGTTHAQYAGFNPTNQFNQSVMTATNQTIPTPQLDPTQLNSKYPRNQPTNEIAPLFQPTNEIVPPYQPHDDGTDLPPQPPPSYGDLYK